MKFRGHPFWKHKRCMDVFVFVKDVTFDNGHTAELFVDWMTQGPVTFWVNQFNETLMVSSKEYVNWQIYLPQGKLWESSLPPKSWYEISEVEH